MIALPSAPAGARRRQLFVGTALACAAAASMFMGMLALWLRMRDQARAAGTAWLPDGVKVPEVALIVVMACGIVMMLVDLWQARNEADT